MNPESSIERALIDALYSDTVALEDAVSVYQRITPDHFTDKRLGLLFEAASELFAEAPSLVETAGAITHLRRAGKLEAAGGVTFVTVSTSLGASGANVTHWAKIVCDEYLRRSFAAVGVEILEAVEDRTKTVEEIAEETNAKLRNLSADANTSKLLPSKNLLTAEFKEIERRYNSGDEDEFIPSGLSEIDVGLGGFVRSELTILAGRPSMGKTSLALLYALNVARSGREVLFFSLEMGQTQVAHRLIAMGSGIQSRDLRQPKARMRDRWQQLTTAINDACVDGFLVDDSSRTTTAGIRAAVRSRVLRANVGLVVVDYLQLVRPSGKAYSREQEVATISAELKAIAKEMRVPVLCLAQLNRATEQQADKLPTLANLRESGSIEQDADVVQFVHRPGYYDATAGSKIAKIVVAKNRNGSTGVMDVWWNGPRTLFYDKGKELT